MTTLSFRNAFSGQQFQSFSHRGSTGLGWVLIHGFPGTPFEMRPTADALAALGHGVEGVLLPGFGSQIDSINAYGMDDWLIHCRAAIRRLRADHSSVGIVGLSMGGALATVLAAEKPADALILLAPFWQLDHVLWKALPLLHRVIPQFQPFRLFKPDWNDPGFRASVKNFLPDADFDDPATRTAITDFRVPVRLFNEIRRAGVAGAAAAPRVTCPTLIIQGQQDELVRPETTRELLNLFRNRPTYLELPSTHTITDSTTPGWHAVQQEIVQFASRIMEKTHG